ncbi:DUF1540 domain-containing protein [Mechercharimyces sp. CAU 1602]|uniref:DUF1540 domain-containing protein n=1 Tax=Mechercharimyces sp. CAU 1602 TaxID=2973933 RepID=UPI002161BBD5|nr:DUF1540 domain-containing protein [Mechercharimyces sp. CAU 1602]MCS1350510.1 DUF1540 domain-containing protein [Mechercharimyces sp. CAU 1602]
MPQVKCSVANCHYWEQGNNCSADAIMVDVDSHDGKNYNEEIGGEMIDTRHQDYNASKPADTCCHTFKKKGA